MKEFFTNLWNKLKSPLSILGSIFAAFLGYKIYEQDNEIKNLKEDKFQLEADKVIQTETEKLNEIKKQADSLHKTMDKDTSDLESNESKLKQLRDNRPK